MSVLAIDPGTTQSAYCIIDTHTYKPILFGIVPNPDLRSLIIQKSHSSDFNEAAVETIVSYGNQVGKETFETCFWIGRYLERLELLGVPCQLIERPFIKKHLCGKSTKIKDTHIMHALCNRFSPDTPNKGKGTKDAPGFFYGFRADIWSAYAVGVTYIDTKTEGGLT